MFTLAAEAPRSLSSCTTSKAVFDRREPSSCQSFYNVMLFTAAVIRGSLTVGSTTWPCTHCTCMHQCHLWYSNSGQSASRCSCFSSLPPLPATWVFCDGLQTLEDRFRGPATSSLADGQVRPVKLVELGDRGTFSELRGDFDVFFSSRQPSVETRVQVSAN